jgi:hypothetical protein
MDVKVVEVPEGVKVKQELNGSGEEVQEDNEETVEENKIETALQGL